MDFGNFTIRFTGFARGWWHGLQRVLMTSRFVIPFDWISTLFARI